MEELLTLLARLNSADIDIERRLQLLEAYCERFDAWYREAGNSLEAGQLSQGEELARLHNELIDRATKWLSEARTELKAHHVKGKGILTYTDLLPKRIGLLRGKSG